MGQQTLESLSLRPEMELVPPQADHRTACRHTPGAISRLDPPGRRRMLSAMYPRASLPGSCVHLSFPGCHQVGSAEQCGSWCSARCTHLVQPHSGATQTREPDSNTLAKQSSSGTLATEVDLTRHMHPMHHSARMYHNSVHCNFGD